MTLSIDRQTLLLWWTLVKSLVLSRGNSINEVTVRRQSSTEPCTAAVSQSRRLPFATTSH